MSSGPNGDLHTPITRRVRVDPDRREAVEIPPTPGTRHSGRGFVIAAGISLVVILGMLYAAFLNWRATHLQIVAFGRDEVAPMVQPMADIEPPGVDAATWDAAVADTRAMIAAVTAAGMLDRPKLAALRDELRARVEGATPATAVSSLRAIWDDLERRAGPVMTREFQRPPHPPRRPPILRNEASEPVPAAEAR